MKKAYFILSIFFVFISCGSQNEKSKSIKEQKKTKEVSVNFEFLQSKNLQKAKETLIVAIDPHGDGKLAVSKFKEISENFDCTIIGLNDVENNVPDFEEKIRKDINAAKTNLNLKLKHFFITGFSGGARMAFQYALLNKADGVIMCGAGINMQKINQVQFPLAMIIGTRDFNFIEQYYSPFSPVVKNKNLLTLLFEGIHEWPPEDDILSAMIFLFNKAGIPKETKRDFLKEGDDYLKSKQYFKAFKSYEVAYKTDVNGSDKKLDGLLKDVNFKNFTNKFENSLQKEYERNNKYVSDLKFNDLKWWYDEVLKINELLNSKNKFNAASYARTKAYLGIAMYSLVGREINDPWSKMTDKYLKIYEYLEPENPDLWFFNAVREKQKNNSSLSKKYLKRAYVFGFKDTLKGKKYGLFQ